MMKKFSSIGIIIISIISIGIISISVSLLFIFQNKYITSKKNYENIISKEYYNTFAENLTPHKFKSVILQSMGARQGDNLLMFGSSEFENNTAYPTHPIKFFNNERDGFQINLIGRAGYKSLVEAANFGALGNELKGKKVVFVLSPQWFTPSGIDENAFEANSSELQVYGFLFNKDISLVTKQEFSKRIISITFEKANKQFAIMRTFCSLYSKKDLLSTCERYLITPYYWVKYEQLILKDDKDSINYLKSKPKPAVYSKPQHTAINWDVELRKATKISKSKSSNNNFGMISGAYNIETKGNLQKIKGSWKNSSYKISPEYKDFELLLDVCKENGIKPLILNIPVNGKWYDYAGFSKSDRLAYYRKIDTMVNSYGFEVADFSKYEYEKYFLMDSDHIGWKGWVYVNKAIDSYYNRSN